jgi:hypothetical protein
LLHRDRLPRKVYNHPVNKVSFDYGNRLFIILSTTPTQMNVTLSLLHLVYTFTPYFNVHFKRLFLKLRDVGVTSSDLIHLDSVHSFGRVCKPAKCLLSLLSPSVRTYATTRERLNEF